MWWCSTVSENHHENAVSTSNQINNEISDTKSNSNTSISQKASSIAKSIAISFNIPEVKTVWESCNEENARYDPESQTITVCNEMIDILQSFANKQDANPDIVREITENSTLFIYLHELGHAYIDLLKLPITWKEEDVADQIASYFITSLKGDTAYTMLIDGANSFYEFSQQDSQIDDNKLADVHSLDKQRYYNILCRLYGFDPDDQIITELWLPTERAENCQSEYELMKESLDILFGKNEEQ